MTSPNDRNQTIAAAGVRWLLSIVVAARAFHYCQAAQRDERDRFPCTAAMEWRNAAELFGPSTVAAEYCWRQWERIMQLPRRLAGPIGVRQIAAFAVQPTSVNGHAMAPVIDKISLATAA